VNKKLKTYHNNVWGGHVGMIKNEEEYEAVKNGTRDWKPHIKEQITAIQIPAEVFYRLMKMDRTVTTIPFEVEVTEKGGAE
jgi:hypothetical protein